MKNLFGLFYAAMVAQARIIMKPTSHRIRPHRTRTAGKPTIRRAYAHGPLSIGAHDAAVRMRLEAKR